MPRFPNAFERLRLGRMHQGDGMRYKSLIGGAIGDVGFESGDMIDVPDHKVDEWLAAGLIEPAPQKKAKVVDIFATDGATAGDRVG
jgi:hypothetical protein